MARKQAAPAPITPAELEAEFHRRAASDPDAGRQLQEALSAPVPVGAMAGEAMEMPAFFARFLQAYELLDRLGVIEWIRTRRAGKS